MPNIFESQGFSKPRYSAFDLSREQKLSCTMGKLVPTYLEEVVPGDQFRVKTETLLRLAPMLAPIMHRVRLSIHYFYVPNRLVWNQWEDFITGGRDANSSPTFPKLDWSDEMGESKLADYLGLPISQITSATEGDGVSAIPFRAYLKIWNDYFRDENLQDEIDVETATATQLLTLRNRCWEKDYFTSALPWSQRGGTQAAVPAVIDYKTVATGSPPDTVNATVQIRNTGTIFQNGAGNPGLKIENLNSISILINELRKSSALQRWLEKQAKGGYRLIETMLSQFGVKSDDLRLQRPQYLGGGSQPIIISEVLNTTGTEAAPQGDMAGHGFATGTTNHFSETFKEHGYVMGILSVMPKTAYQNGVPRHFSRDDRFDYYWPEFANLGEQEIKRKEVQLKTLQSYNEDTFGYQQRFAEYKYGNSTVHGDFRNTLDFWHMGRIFEDVTTQSLNSAFVTADPTTRIFNVEDQDNDNLWIQLYHDVKARRPMPFFADPRLS